MTNGPESFGDINGDSSDELDPFAAELADLDKIDGIYDDDADEYDGLDDSELVELLDLGLGRRNERMWVAVDICAVADQRAADLYGEHPELFESSVRRAGRIVVELCQAAGRRL